MGIYVYAFKIKAIIQPTMISRLQKTFMATNSTKSM